MQSDRTLLLEIGHERSDSCRSAIAPFAELEKAPEHVHTYRITPLALWNARAAGHDPEQCIDVLLTYSRYDIAQSVLIDIVDTMGRYGRLVIENDPINDSCFALSTTQCLRKCRATNTSHHFSATP